MDFTIGELARRTGVKAPTIRYYEQIGLIAEPRRSGGGQRLYDRGAVERLNFIGHARDLGFEIQAIRELLAMNATPKASCSTVDGIARRHLEEIERRIRSLTALHVELSRMVEQCGHGQICDCRVIEVLNDHSLCGGRHQPL